MNPFNRIWTLFHRVPEDPRSEIEQLRDAVIEWQAERLQISPAEARTQLSRRRALRGTAASDEFEVSLDALNADVKLDAFPYPTDDCLEPHEVDAYFGDSFPRVRVQHVKDCPFCSTLVEIAVPPTKKREEFERHLDEIGSQPADFDFTEEDELVGSYDREAVSLRKTYPSERGLSGAGLWLVAAACIAGLASLGVNLLSPGVPNRNEHPTLAVTPSPSTPSAVFKFVTAFGEQLAKEEKNSDLHIVALAVSGKHDRMAVSTNTGDVFFWENGSQDKVIKIDDFSGQEALQIAFAENGHLTIDDRKQKFEYGSAGRLVSKSPASPTFKIFSLPDSDDSRSFAMLAQVNTKLSDDLTADHLNLLEQWTAGSTPATTSVRTSLLWAELLARHKRYPEAIALYRQMLTKEDATPEEKATAGNNLAHLLLTTGDKQTHAESLKLIDEAIAVAGRKPELLNTRAQILVAQGDFVGALVDQKDAAAASPTGPNLYFLAHVQMQNDDPTSARETVSKVQELVGQLSPAERQKFDELVQRLGISAPPVRTEDTGGS